MRFKIPNINFINENYESICSWINTHHSEPFHKTNLMEHKRKYLGHYVKLVLEPSSDLSEHFLVYDLYTYEGSKFTERTFIAVYGDNQSDYESNKESDLKDKDNKELTQIPTGEAYRRFKKRKQIQGSLNKLR